MEWLHAIDKKYASRKILELNEIHDLIRNRLFTNAQQGVHIHQGGVNKKNNACID